MQPRGMITLITRGMILITLIRSNGIVGETVISVMYTAQNNCVASVSVILLL